MFGGEFFDATRYCMFRFALRLWLVGYIGGASVGKLTFFTKYKIDIDAGNTWLASITFRMI